MLIRKIFLALFFLSGVSLSMPNYAQRSFSDYNTAYWCDIYGDIQLNHQPVFYEDSIVVLLQVTMNNSITLGQLKFHYEVQKSYNDESVLYVDSLNTRDDALFSVNNQHLFQFSVPRIKDGKLLVLKISKEMPQRTYYYDINLDEQINFGNAGLYFTISNEKVPYLQSFINVNTTLRIQNAYDDDTLIYAYYYDHDFETALPPMITEDRQIKKELVLDSVFTVNIGEAFTLNAEGLYFFQTDTASLEGISLRVADKYYPTFRTMTKIIEPLRYISTSEETDLLQSSANQKTAFEKYWLKLLNDPSTASEIMGKFYSQVEEANFFFTNYKEGWKTDMGMIYIVYGKPDEVYKGEETIDWVYNKSLNLPIIRFTFIKVKNVFTDHHYSLMRKNNFDRHWMMSVKMWREGRK